MSYCSKYCGRYYGIQTPEDNAFSMFGSTKNVYLHIFEFRYHDFLVMFGRTKMFLAYFQDLGLRFFSTFGSTKNEKCLVRLDYF